MSRILPKIVAVILFLLLFTACTYPANPAGNTYTPVKTTTPTPTPTPTFTYSPLPTPTRPKVIYVPAPTVSPTPPVRVTERATIIVDPGQVSEVPLFLENGEKADVKIEVISRALNLFVRDPYDNIIISAKQIISKEFSLTATAAGNYRLVFLIDSATDAYNRIVNIDFTYHGGQIPPPKGENIFVTLGDTGVYSLVLAEGQGVKGSFTIQGGDSDITFSARSQTGGTVVASKNFVESGSFVLPGVSAGEYYLYFNNSARYASKIITLDLSTNPGGIWQSWWGTPTRLSFTRLPEATAPGAFKTPPAVSVLDGAGGVIDTFSGPVTLSLLPESGSSGAVLTGNSTVTAVNGVATFTGLGINIPGTDYILTATSPGLFSVTSDGFNVSTGSNSSPKYTLQVNIMPVRGGTVTISPNESSYPSGTKVTLKAEPGAGFKFVSWGGSILGPVSTMEIIMDSNKVVTASFTPVNW